MSENHGNGCDQITPTVPSNMHLKKKELTAIRKASRVLRDPDTTSSWKSPLNSSRSNYNISTDLNSKNPVVKSPENLGFQQQQSQNQQKQRVFLYNWKIQRSSSEKSAAAVKQGDEEEDDDVNRRSVSGSEDTLGDGQKNRPHSKIGTVNNNTNNSGSSMIFRCGDATVGSLSATPSMRRSITNKKKNLKKNPHSSTVLLRNRQQKRVLLNNAKISTYESLEESSEDYSLSEDLLRVLADSPLPSKLIKGDNKPPHPALPSKSKLLIRNSRKDDSSYTYNSTPALSTSSINNRYRLKKQRTVGSWDGTSASYNDGDDEDEDELDAAAADDDHLGLPGRQGCGIPCYWSKKTPKHRGEVCGSCYNYSPSLSDTLRRKGSRILCGSQTMYNRRRSSGGSVKKRRIVLRNGQGVLPLLANSYDGRGIGSSMGTGRSDDELSTNYGELDLEALSRLDGRRWSSCRSQEGFDKIVARKGEKGEEESSPENMKSLSQKYRPIFFDDLIGQNIVVQSLANAILKNRNAPVYLFQGPRGTGKTSAARIFASALNCLATEETKPCGYCRECVEFVSGKSRYLKEVDGTNKKGIDRIRYFLKNLPLRSSSAAYSSPFHIFAIDECHLIPSKTWLAFLKFLEDPPTRVVFIFITTDLDNVPRTVLSRCQKYIFNKIKDGDIGIRLRNIASDENLDVESDALDLIASNADGSLRDAETMLDQLSLLGKRITASLVNELVGIVSDEKLLELLELAMSSDTAETVKRARELMESGADPMVLMSQLASLVMDIIAGSSHTAGHSLSEGEIEKLKHALKILSEAEKQLRLSSERSTWFTATLLQLGSAPSPDLTLSSSSRRQSSKTTEEDPSTTSKEASSLQLLNKQKIMSPANLPSKLTNQQSVSHDDAMFRNMIYRSIKPEQVEDIWSRCIDRCHSKTVRQLLYTHAMLVSVSEAEGGLVAHIAFSNGDIKLRAERFLSSITNSFEIVLKRNVEIRIILLPNSEASSAYNATKSNRSTQSFPIQKQIDQELSRESFDDLAEGKQRKQVIPILRIESIIRDQRLETAWLQASTERSTPVGSMSRLKPEKNQVLPQDGSFHSSIIGMSSREHWEDDLNRELKVLKINEVIALQKDQTAKHLTPSLLHDGSLAGNFSRDTNLGYESGSTTGGYNGLFCWSNTRPHNRRKVNQGSAIQSQRGRRFLCFGECGELKNRSRR